MKTQNEEQIFWLDEVRVAIDQLDVQGSILDIGGGGEGVIGRINAGRVIAIDLSKDELEASPAGPLKVVMNGSKLAFPDSTFPMVTAFFCLMYIPDGDLSEVFREVRRVLKPDRDFLIWDVVIPQRRAETQDIVAVQTSIFLPEGEIQTGYGVKWPEEGRDLPYYSRLGENAGFRTVDAREEKGAITLRFRDPGS